MDLHIGEGELRVKSVEDMVNVIENHVEFALIKFNELHNTHIPS